MTPGQDQARLEMVALGQELDSEDTCRHCGGLIVPCGEAISFCAGWKHAAYLHYGPVGAHYCEGRSINPLAEPDPRPASMLQSVTFSGDGEDEARHVPMRPVDEAEDAW